MKKLVIVALSAVLALMAVEPANAQAAPTIAIIDSAVDSSKVKNIVHEVCFTTNASCLNKTNYQDGKGSAGVLRWTSSLDHGNRVAQAALFANPNVKIVFIRIANEEAKMDRLDSISRQQAMNWIALNAKTFGITAVSISASLGVNTQASCQVYGLTTSDIKNKAKQSSLYSQFKSSVDTLSANGVLVFAAAGNNGVSGLGFPACIDTVVSVGATRLSGTAFASYSNRGPNLKAVARGDAPELGSGTSIATPIAAVFTVTNINGRSLSQFMQTLPNKIGYPQFNN
jgi:hypothetical protein